MYKFEVSRTSTFNCRRRAIFNSLYELNETQTTVRPTVGDTYNEIENEPVSFGGVTDYNASHIHLSKG